MTEAIQDTRRARPALILGLLFIVFMGPMIFAWGVYKRSDSIEFSYMNNGDLVLPPLPMEQIRLSNVFSMESTPTSSLLGHWTMVYLLPNHCQEECLQNVYFLRQIHTALGRDSDRAQRMLWYMPNQSTEMSAFFKETYPEMQQNILNEADFNQYIDGIVNKVEESEVGAFYIIDPHGNLMMSYPGDIEYKGILKDIKRLLKVSNIG